ncbi:MAG: ABC transporter ATP-binding protein [Planctomycetota bacterium]|nr:ABC transporter ATP-binding protein [Planctomycetota bacterium]
MAVIDIHDVEKTYKGKIHALRGVSLEVHDGEIFGLLGPNGAGKSTLVKILMTVIHASKVSGTFLGQPIGHRPSLRKVGYLPEHHRFPQYLTAIQVLQFYGALSKVPRPIRTTRAYTLLERLGLTGWEKKKVSTFSKGMRQRLGIAIALINDPTVVVLDEPTDGVDPVGRREIRDLLAELKTEGKAVFLNSHLLSELEMVCDRVAIMVKGQMTMQGTIDELTRDSTRFEINIQGDVPEWAEQAFDDVRGTMLIKHGDDTQQLQSLIDTLRADNVTIGSIEPKRESLEDLFMRAVDHIDNPGSIR